MKNLIEKLELTEIFGLVSIEKNDPRIQDAFAFLKKLYISKADVSSIYETSDGESAILRLKKPSVRWDNDDFKVLSSKSPSPMSFTTDSHGIHFIFPISEKG